MELTITQTKEEWEFILEAISLIPYPQIKNLAMGMIKTRLDEQFEQLNQKQDGNG